MNKYCENKTRPKKALFDVLLSFEFGQVILCFLAVTLRVQNSKS